MTLLAFCWRYFRRYTTWIIVAAVSVLLFAATTTALVVLIEPIFGEVLLAGEGAPGPLGMVAGDDKEADEEGGAVSSLPEPLQDLLRRLDLKDQLRDSYESVKRRLDIDQDEVVYFVPILFVVFFLFRSVAHFFSGYSFQRIGLGATTTMRNDLYRHILHQSNRFHAEHPSGELVSRVVGDVALLQSAVSNRLLDLFQQSVTLVALLVLLLSTHLRLALICVVVAPIVLFPVVRFGRGMRKTSHRSQERLADLTSLLAEGVRGHRVVKAFGTENFEYERFRTASRRHLRVNLWAQMLAHLSSPVVETLAVIGAAAFLVYAGRSIRAGELTVEMLIAFLTNLLLMYDPIRKLNKVNLILQQATAAASRIASVMAIDSEVQEDPQAKPIRSVEEGIHFENVRFAYEDDVVLHDVDLTVNRGEIVALVGPSGAGKSTLVNLLPRFFDPDAGRVTIDGRDLRELPLADLRSLIGIVTQETMLFDDTVRNNIAYGRADLPFEAVREAAKAAYAEEFVEDLPSGYETRLGEAGLRLSGGQRQRLAIARALCKNAPILVLDEATSQLDSESESLVQKALYNLMQGRTTLVIAHRLSTVMKADKIVVLEAGRVIEAGNHADLLAHGGTYKRLYDLQFRD